MYVLAEVVLEAGPGWENHLSYHQGTVQNGLGIREWVKMWETCHVWWGMPAVPAIIRKLRQEDHYECEDSLDYTARSYSRFSKKDMRDIDLPEGYLDQGLLLLAGEEYSTVVK